MGAPAASNREGWDTNNREGCNRPIGDNAASEGAPSPGRTVHAAAVETTRRAGPFDVLSALRYPNYRLYWSGQVCSVAGMTMEWVVLGWLVYELTSSPLSLGATGLAQSLPRIALALLGGAVADRVDRRRLLVLTQSLSAVVYLGLALLVVSEAVQLWHVLGAAFLLGCLRAFDGPSRQALIPHMVPREELGNAVALSNLAWEVPRLGGPALAGVLIASVGNGPTLYVACIGFLVAAVLFSLLQAPASVRQGDERLRDSLLGGIAFIRGHQVFYVLIGMTFFNSVFGMSYQVLLPIFARDILEVGSQGFGLLQTAVAVGATAGSLAAAALAKSRGRGWYVLGGSLAFGLFLAGFALSQWFLLSAAFLFLAGIANSIYMTAIATSLQLRVPDEYRARVMAVYGLTWSLQPLGAIITGTVAEFTTAPVALALGASLVAILPVAIAASAPKVRQLQ